MGRGCTSPMQCSRRKRVLGRLLLWRHGTVNLSHSGVRLGRADHLHMGRFCVHVHWNHASHATPCEAQETVETSPRWSRLESLSKKNLTIQPHHCSSASRPLGFKFRICGQDAHMVWHLLIDRTLDVGIWPWMTVPGAWSIGRP